MKLKTILNAQTFDSEITAEPNSCGYYNKELHNPHFYINNTKIRINILKTKIERDLPNFIEYNWKFKFECYKNS